ncbi:hypothetical protein YC2023_088785 [Brassica napus]
MICCISMRRYGETELLNLERQSPSWIRSGRLLQLRLAEELSDSDPKNSGGGSSELSLPVTLPLDSYASAHENPRQTHYPDKKEKMDDVLELHQCRRSEKKFPWPPLLSYMTQ